MLETKDDRLLTPEQFFDEKRKKQEDARDKQEKLDDFNESERAFIEGRDVTAKGKPVRGQGRQFKKETPQDKRLREIFEEDFGDSGFTFAGAARFVQHVLEHTSTALSGTFGNKAKQQLNARYEDDHYLYDTMQVSDPVYHKLIEESDAITAKIEQLQAIKDPVLREALERQIEEMATDFEMRLHPITEKYVHDYARVMREEVRHTEHCHLSGIKLGAKNHLVCIFQLKQEMGDTRKVKRDVGDQFDNKVEEKISSGEHLKGAPAPTPP